MSLPVLPARDCPALPPVAGPTRRSWADSCPPPGQLPVCPDPNLPPNKQPPAREKPSCRSPGTPPGSCCSERLSSGVNDPLGWCSEPWRPCARRESSIWGHMRGRGTGQLGMTTCSQAGRGEGWEVGGTTTLPSPTQQNQAGILADIKMVLDRGDHGFLDLEQSPSGAALLHRRLEVAGAAHLV